MGSLDTISKSLDGQYYSCFSRPSCLEAESDSLQADISRSSSSAIGRVYQSSSKFKMKSNRAFIRLPPTLWIKLQTAAACCSSILESTTRV